MQFTREMLGKAGGVALGKSADDDHDLRVT